MDNKGVPVAQQGKLEDETINLLATVTHAWHRLVQLVLSRNKNTIFATTATTSLTTNK
ncbi:unnamed protein product, partial [Didymodactylos carnosus]